VVRATPGPDPAGVGTIQEVVSMSRAKDADQVAQETRRQAEALLAQWRAQDGNR
jgi:hypothetical protein